MYASEIRPGLWQSDYPDDMTWLPSHGIRTVINVINPEQARARWGVYPPTYPAGIAVALLPLLDSAGAPAPSLTWLRAAGECVARATLVGPVLVHCAAGGNRSTIAICMGLINLHDIDWESALQIVKAQRPIAQPASWWLHDLETRAAQLRDIWHGPNAGDL